MRIVRSIAEVRDEILEMELRDKVQFVRQRSTKGFANEGKCKSNNSNYKFDGR